MGYRTSGFAPLRNIPELSASSVRLVHVKLEHRSQPTVSLSQFAPSRRSTSWRDAKRPVPCWPASGLAEQPENPPETLARSVGTKLWLVRQEMQ